MSGYAGFVHLRVHSAYSLSEGAIKMKAIPKLASQHKMPAVALTDTRNMFGALEFSYGCKDVGVQPIIGSLVFIESLKKPEGNPKFHTGAVSAEPQQIVLLAQNETGYKSLMELLSRAYMNTDSSWTPHISYADLTELNAGLICLSGGAKGPINGFVADGQIEKAAQAMATYTAIFEDRFYIELMRHGLPNEAEIEDHLVDLAYANDVPIVATNDVFFDTPEMYEAHDALLCIADKTFIATEDRRRVTPDHYFKSAEEMQALFEDLPEAIENTLHIARRCAFMVDFVKPILPVMPKVDGDEAEFLRKMAAEGLQRRLEVHVFTPHMTTAEKEDAAKAYWERLDYELGIINTMGFPGYFLIVADFIQWAKDQDIPVGPGRGSGAGSLVAYALTITDLDPIRFGLLFERFLNPERVSMPDFDIDFCQDRREEVIHYVQNEYGRDRVAQIITFGKLQARAVLRNVGRVLQMSLGFVDRICKMVPNAPGSNVTLAEALEQEPDLRKLVDTEEEVKQLFDLAMKLEGLYSHASTHAAGVVIGKMPLHELVALYRDPNSDMPVTQFNMKFVEQAGLVKFDFLGLKTLTVLQKAVQFIAQKGIDINLSEIPLDDRPSYDLLTSGDTFGVFQLESQGMRDTLRKLRPDTLEDIIAIVALYRPGPMDNIPIYTARKHGEEETIYMHDSLKDILEETYGIMIYQEQVMQAAQIMASYTLGGADLLRRAMGKKIKEEMDKQRALFVEGCEKNGTSAEKASEVFDQIAKFAGYGFNKSHAACYALVAYQTAYLKANYPAEFMAAVMTYDMQNTDKLALSKDELRRLHIPLLPPDINKSDVEFSVEPIDGENGSVLAVRYALAGIKNVGEAAMESIVRIRREKGAFKSIQDFAGRLDPKQINKRLLENLVRAGAMDCLAPTQKPVPNRKELFDGIEIIMKQAQAKAEERASDQMGMFSTVDDIPNFKLPKSVDWTTMDRLSEERRALGFYLSAHPLDSYKDSLERLRIIPSDILKRHVEAGGTSSVKLAGLQASRRERVSQRGNKYAFVALDDSGGSYEVTMFSEVLQKSRDMLDSGKPLILTVDCRIEEDNMRLTCHNVDLLDNAVARSTKKLLVYVSAPECLPRVQDILSRDQPGNGRVVMVIETDQQEIQVDLPHRLSLSATTIGEMKNIPGIARVREI